MAKKVMTSYAVSQILIEIILDSGMSIKEFEGLTNISRSQIGDPDLRIPMSSLLKLWQTAIDITGDPALALHLRKKTGLRSVHFLVSLALCSSSFLEAIFHFYRYSRLISDAEKREFFEEDDYFKSVYINLYPEYQNRWLPEHNFSFAVELARSYFSNSNIPIVEVHFQHPDPGYAKVYDEVFQAPVLFQQPRSMIVVRKKDLMQETGTHNPQLQKILKEYAEQSMKNRVRSGTLQYKIRQHIITRLPNGGTDIHQTSTAMNMDRSTLYRQLKTEGTTFQDLLLKTRKELAKNYLGQGMANLQVTYLLGFSEPSTFQRAFKSWFNISPGEYRKSATIDL